MRKTVLGIDVGTSAMKVLFVQDGEIRQRSRSLYKEDSPDGWKQALKETLAGIEDLAEVDAIGFSSQVGTYFMNQKDLLFWYGKEGEAYVDGIVGRYPQEVFISETGMPHPRLASYPLPRLCYAKDHFSPVKEVAQPKDLTIRYLTGRYVSDVYSWRGLASAGTCRYSRRLLQDIGISESILPELRMPWQEAGKISPSAARETGLPEGISVYTGLNDFYAALLGMGITKTGDWFDITGTSEHLGLLEDSLCPDTTLISSPYLSGYVHYGVTAASGTSLMFGEETFSEGIGKETLPDKFWETVFLQGSDDPEAFFQKAPVFLPYLNGERAPVFDPDAKGAFYGITGKTRPEHMAYAVAEGVAFSLYHIYSCLKTAGSGILRVCGGNADNSLLNYLKAELLQKDITAVCEKEASAFGAALTALYGEKEITSLEEAAGLVRTERKAAPDGRVRRQLLARFDKYLELYQRVRGL